MRRWQAVAEKKILKHPVLHYVAELAEKEAEGGTQEPVVREGFCEVQELTLDAIDLENTQFEYRLDPGIELLMDSIRRDGQQIPVIVRGTQAPYQLICGFRRTRSLKALGEAKVKAIVLEALSDERAHRLSVLENEERKSLTDLDKANACKKLYDEGRTQEEVAEIMNRSRISISRYLTLLKSPAPVFEALRKGRIQAMHAVLLNQAYDKFNEEQILEFIEQVANKVLSTRELERIMRRAGAIKAKPAR